MLVKLGNTWFNPKLIDCISSSVPPLGLTVSANGQPLKPLGPGPNHHYVYVQTSHGNHVTIAYMDSAEKAEAYAEEMASAVNSALTVPYFEVTK